VKSIKPPIRPFELDPADGSTFIAEAPPKTTTPEEPIAGTLDGGPRGPRGWRAWIWPMFGVGALGLLALQTWLFVSALVASSPMIGVLAALFLSLVAISLLGLVWRELADLQSMQQRAEIRDEASRLSRSELHGGAGPLLEQVSKPLLASPGSAALVKRYNAHHSDTHTDAEALALFERSVLEPLDKRAYRIAMESSRDIGLLTALSPLGMLDGLLVLWRTTLMLRQIARLYGLSLGPTATWRLLRTCLRNAVIAGVADAVSHAALEHVGASITAMLSARAGQGAGNALLSARLGLEAIKQSRPLPYMTLDPPRMKQLRDAIFNNGLKTPK